MEDRKKCKKVNTMVDAIMECEPNIGRVFPRTGETKAQATERELKDWLKQFNSFLRDHRSQDEVHLSVNAVFKDICSSCGKEFELANIGYGEYDELEYKGCANCGAELETESVAL